MKLLFHLCAISSAIDITTNQVSLFNLLEQMNVASFPVVIPSITIISSLEREKGDRTKLDLQIRFTLGRKVIAEFPFEADFQKGLRHRNTAEVRGLMIPGPGILKIGLRYKDKPMGSAWSIDVIGIGEATLEETKARPAKPATRKKSTEKRRISARPAPKANKVKTSNTRKNK